MLTCYQLHVEEMSHGELITVNGNRWNIVELLLSLEWFLFFCLLLNEKGRKDEEE